MFIAILRILHDIVNYIENIQINVLNFIYIGFIVTIVVFGSLLNLVEEHLPVAIRQSFRYGKHAYKGPKDRMVSSLEVPKSWFKHFYVFAGLWSLAALVVIYRSTILGKEAPKLVLHILDLMAGGRRAVQVDSTHALVSIVLMTMQCWRRFYETHFMQIFSKTSKINLSHYMVGYIHYFGVFLVMLANTQGFVRNSQAEPFSLSKLTVSQYVALVLFLYAWVQQFKANQLLVQLRTDGKTGKVITEKHFMPRGGHFEKVSSPHMFYEVVMYVVLYAFLSLSDSWLWVSVWVISNQTINALLTHKWYKENYANYPKNRKAIIPYLL